MEGQADPRGGAQGLEQAGDPRPLAAHLDLHDGLEHALGIQMVVRLDWNDGARAAVKRIGGWFKIDGVEHVDSEAAVEHADPPCTEAQPRIVG